MKEIATLEPVGHHDEGLESRIDLDRVLAGLSTDERELLALRFALGMSSMDIGAHLGLGPEGARTRLHRLLVKIRKELVSD
jgi:RNA polymerase sigma factor (sigma-70 family)